MDEVFLQSDTREGDSLWAQQDILHTADLNDTIRTVWRLTELGMCKLTHTLTVSAKKKCSDTFNWANWGFLTHYCCSVNTIVNSSHMNRNSFGHSFSLFCEGSREGAGDYPRCHWAREQGAHGNSFLFSAITFMKYNYQCLPCGRRAIWNIRIILLNGVIIT